MPLEVVSNKKIIDFLQDKGAYVVKTISSSKAGVPDIMACLDGKFIAVEGKRKGLKAKQLQQAHLLRIQKAGGIAIVASSIEEVEDGLINPQTFNIVAMIL